MADKLYALNEHIKEASKRTGISQDILKAVITQESGGNPQAISKAGALGAMQLMPETAKSLGVTDPMDPRQNINAGADYLKQLNDKYNGDWNLTLAAYNAGPGNVDKHGGIPPFAETQNYVKNVNRLASKINATNTSEKPIDRLEARYGHLIDANVESKNTGPASAADRLEARYGNLVDAISDKGEKTSDIITGVGQQQATTNIGQELKDGESEYLANLEGQARGGEAFLNRAINAATFGFSDKKLKYLTESPKNEIQAKVQQSLKAGAAQEMARADQLKEQYPFKSTAGDIAGFMIGPGRALGTVLSKLGITGAASVGLRDVAAEGAPAITTAAKALGLAARSGVGAAESALFEGITNKEATVESAKKAALFGGVASPVFDVIGAGAHALYDVANDAGAVPKFEWMRPFYTAAVNKWKRTVLPKLEANYQAEVLKTDIENKIRADVVGLKNKTELDLAAKAVNAEKRAIEIENKRAIDTFKNKVAQARDEITRFSPGQSQELANNLANKAKTLKKELGAAYKETQDKTLKVYESAPADTTSILTYIDSRIRDDLYLATDATEDVIRAAVAEVRDSNNADRIKKLIKIRDQLAPTIEKTKAYTPTPMEALMGKTGKPEEIKAIQPTIGKVKRAMQELQGAELYNDPLYYKLKQNLYDNLGEVGGKEAATAFEQANRAYASSIGGLNKAQKFADSSGSLAGKNIVGRVDPTKLGSLLSSNPGLKDDVGNLVLQEFSEATSKAKLDKFLARFDKKTLSTMFDETTVDQLYKKAEELKQALAKKPEKIVPPKVIKPIAEKPKLKKVPERPDFDKQKPMPIEQRIARSRGVITLGKALDKYGPEIKGILTKMFIEFDR